MNTEFLQLVTEDQLILQGLIYRPNQKNTKAYLHIHGMAGNFYENTFLNVMAKELTNDGYSFLSINTRGHDYIADFRLVGIEDKFKRIGNAYETFEECLLDIEAAINWLEQKGYTEIVLCGHSLGAVKVSYYIAKTHDPRVQKLILMSPPDMVGLAEQESYHVNLLALAQQMIKEGRGEELLPQKIWDWYWLSARTYVNLSSRDYPIDVFNTYAENKPSILREVRIPILAFFGEKDDAALFSPSKNLDILRHKIVNAPMFDTDIIEGAPHSYFTQEMVMTKKIVDWLNKQ